MRNRTLQKLDTGVASAVSNRSVVETFVASGTITATDWVQLDDTATGTDIALKVKQAVATYATGNPLVVGVALNSAVAGGTVQVCVGGYCASAKVDAAVAAVGVTLIVDNTAAGTAQAQVAADICIPCGTSLAASAAGVAPVIVYQNF